MRSGWNGKGMHLVLSTPKSSHFIKLDGDKIRQITTDKEYILMYTVDGSYQPGWLASQSDMLSDDWQIAD